MTGGRSNRLRKNAVTDLHKVRTYTDGQAQGNTLIKVQGSQFAFSRREDRKKLALEFFLDHTCRIISFKEGVSSLCEGILASRFRRAAVCCSAGNV
jgi:hypothetical protein